MLRHALLCAKGQEGMQGHAWGMHGGGGYEGVLRGQERLEVILIREHKGQREDKGKGL